MVAEIGASQGGSENSLFGDEAVFDRVAADEDDRDRRCRTFRRQRRRGAARRYDHVDLAADEIGCQFGQPIVTALRPAVFDRQILSLNIAGLGKALVKRGDDGRRLAGQSAAEKTDHRHRPLLRAEGAGYRHRAA